MTRSLLALALMLALPAGSAFADIWECVDGSGNKRFTNIKSEAAGCRMLIVGPTNTVPGGKPQARAAPPGFPKVDGETQEQARKELAVQDSMRLGSERNYQRVLDRLEPYKKKVKLHEDNVANLRRELAGGRGAGGPARPASLAAPPV